MTVNADPEALGIMVPQYELRDGLIAPIPGVAARLVPLDAYLQRWAAKRSAGGEFWPIVRDFNQSDPNAPKDRLAFANRYGSLGAALWDPFTGLKPLPSPKVRDLQAKAYAEVDAQRWLRLCQEGFKPTRVETVCDLASAIAYDPTPLTLSLWHPEPLDPDYA